ncbi:MAG: PaaI family thioesterase [Eubacteriaceae bacterium]|nr:PaaI family thioesterase [Eubacteriaceae bacterium]
MEFKITKMQNNSSMCLLCGLHNEKGLKLHFFQTNDNKIISVANLSEFYQSYPGRLHGGITCTLLDEILGRVSMIEDPDNGWAVTAELSTRFLHPVPLEEDIFIVAQLTKDSRLIYEAEGYIMLSDGRIAAKAKGKYVKTSFDKITDSEDMHSVWFYDKSFKVPQSIIISDIKK